MYPGDLAREEDWQPAERIKDGAVSREEVGREEFAIWTLPKRVGTRALRFTHTAQPSDPKYAGGLGGALMLSDRLTNLAPQAQAVASARDETAGRINDEQAPSGGRGTMARKAAQAISPEHPEWLMLVWPRAVSLSGLEALWAGFGAAEVQIFTGADGEHPREAGDAAWKTSRHSAESRTAIRWRSGRMRCSSIGASRRGRSACGSRRRRQKGIRT